MTSENGRSPLRLIFLFIVVILLPLAVGLYAAPRVVPQPQIGVIRLNYDIFSETAAELKAQLAYARNDPAIKAVVLIVNSPGGTASDSEEVYLDVLNTRQEMPIVTSIDFLAASGAYYIASATDAIYAKPGSVVGSIGVISYLPDAVFLEEDILTTGPYKAFGGTRDAAVRRSETLKFVFLEAVAAGRGERLQADLDLLSRAEVFDGVRAVELGLVDGLISTQEAMTKAAEMAGLRDYEVVELYPLTFGDAESLAQYTVPDLDMDRLWAMPGTLPPGMYYRYIELPSNQ